VFERKWAEYKPYQDPRVSHLPLMSSPFPILGIILSYLIVIFLGILLMRNLSPLSLRPVVILYNIVVILLNIYISSSLFYEAFIVQRFSWVCNPIDNSERGRGMSFTIWLFFFSKIIEILDTIFMVLKKREISFLHVYHHCTVIILWWIGARFVPGGDAYWSSMQNSMVHVIMYIYYLLSSLHINAWWKKYLTSVQMIQFVLNIFHTSFALLNTSCGSIPKWMGYGMVLYMSSLLILFLNFYIHAYKPDPNKIKES